MSRVAKNPVLVPKGVEVNVLGQEISVKGPKGSLSRTVHPSVKIKISSLAELEGQLSGTEASSDADAKVIVFVFSRTETLSKKNAGTARALVNNMVQGVSSGFEKQLDLVGVGYRAQSKGSVLTLNLGYSLPVDYKLPQNVTAETPSATTIILRSIDKQSLGQVAAEIRAIRPPEPYKGKGVKYSSEIVQRKETKKK